MLNTPTAECRYLLTPPPLTKGPCLLDGISWSLLCSRFFPSSFFTWSTFVPRSFLIAQCVLGSILCRPLFSTSLPRLFLQGLCLHFPLAVQFFEEHPTKHPKDFNNIHKAHCQPARDGLLRWRRFEHGILMSFFLFPVHFKILFLNFSPHQ